MRLLLDNCTPNPLRKHLPGHDVSHCADMGWSQLSNGHLLAAAEADGFDLMITCDQSLGYQQSLKGRKIAILVLGIQHWPKLVPHAADVARAVAEMQPGEYREMLF
jgi:hypothetical protein